MDYEALIAFFSEYNEHFRKFLKFEYSKLNMINQGEIEKLSQSLSSEQAFIMKSNMLESKRIGLLGGDITFAELIEEAPENYKAPLESKYKELSEMVFKIKEINDTANIIISERLKKMRTAESFSKTYDGHGDIRNVSELSSVIDKA